MVVCCVPMCAVCAPICVGIGCSLLQNVPPVTLIQTLFWYSIYNHDVFGICCTNKKEKSSYGRGLKIVVLVISLISIFATASISQQISGAFRQEVFKNSRNDRKECLSYKSCLDYCFDEKANCASISNDLSVFTPADITETTTSPRAELAAGFYFKYEKPANPSYKYYLCARDPICFPACKAENNSKSVDARVHCATLPAERREDLFCGPKTLCQAALRFFMPSDNVVDVSCTIAVALLTTPAKFLFQKFLVLFQSKREALGKTKVVIIQITMVLVMSVYMIAIVVTGIVFTVLDSDPGSRLLDMLSSIIFGFFTLLITPFPLNLLLFFVCGGVKKVADSTTQEKQEQKRSESMVQHNPMVQQMVYMPTNEQKYNVPPQQPMYAQQQQAPYSVPPQQPMYAQATVPPQQQQHYSVQPHQASFYAHPNPAMQQQPYHSMQHYAPQQPSPAQPNQ